MNKVCIKICLKIVNCDGKTKKIECNEIVIVVSGFFKGLCSHRSHWTPPICFRIMRFRRLSFQEFHRTKRVLEDSKTKTLKTKLLIAARVKIFPLRDPK